MSDQKRTPRQGPALPGKSPRTSPANGNPADGSRISKGSGAKPPAPKAAPPVRSNPATRSIPVIKPQQPASNGRPAPNTDRTAGPAKPLKAAKPGKAARQSPGAKRPAAAKRGPNQGGVPKGLLGAKGGAKRPAVRPGPGAKEASGPADKPGTGQDTPAASAARETPTALPDLSAHTDAPAWLSTDGSHDAELWDGAFDAEAAAGAPAEPSIVPAEDVQLEEPSLETPAISSEAAEAASLTETAAEVRAVSEEAAEAGKQAGISEPAPEGTEVAVEPGAGLTDLEPGTAEATPDTDGTEEPAPVPEEDGNTPSDTDTSKDVASDQDKTANGTSGAEPAEGTAGDSSADTAPGGAADSGAADSDAAADGDSGNTDAPKPEKDAKAAPAAAAIQTSAVQSGSADITAPVTDSFESLTLTKKDPVETGLTHTVNPSGSSAVPSDSRRARRTREAEEAAARGKGAGKTTRALVLLGSILIVVLLGIWLATVIADSNREEGVLEDSVSPVDLEAGACLQDFQSVNSEVTVVTCETPHNAQLVATSSYADSDTFPGTSALAAKAEEVCSSVIYTDAASKYTDLELNRAVPTQNSWDAGDRRVDCFVVAPGEDLTESLIVQP
ncbi:MAG: septum formation family protein [Arthrobacter sp.]